MEIGPIFRSLRKNQTRTWLVAIEVALTLAVVCNCLVMIDDQRSQMQRETGLDVANIFRAQSAPFAPEFQEEDYLEASFEEDLRAIKSIPGVIGVTSINAIPLSGGGSSTGRVPQGSEIDPVSCPYFFVLEDGHEALGVELERGRWFEAGDFIEEDEDDDTSEDEEAEPAPRNVIVSAALANRLFPDDDPLGKIITNYRGGNQERIVGIVSTMHNAWPLSDRGDSAMLRPGRFFNSRRTTYLVRTEPGRRGEVMPAVEKALRDANAGRIVRVETLTEIKEGYYSFMASINDLLTWMSVLLVIVTALGIVGLTSFSVTQRTRQIGTRRALGATRWMILRYFLVETSLTTWIGLVLGAALTIGLNLLLAHYAEIPQMDPWVVLIGLGGLWAVGLLAALIPAMRGTLVAPVVATRTV